MAEDDPVWRAHKMFAAAGNNETWDLLDAAEIGPDSPAGDRERLLYGAYASLYHWKVVGTVVNQIRGEHLVSRAAAAVGLPDVALRHATRCLELCEQFPGDIEDWDIAFAYEAAARAVAGVGDLDQAAALRAVAEERAAAVADDGARSMVESELAKGPWFGL